MYHTTKPTKLTEYLYNGVRNILRVISFNNNTIINNNISHSLITVVIIIKLI